MSDMRSTLSVNSYEPANYDASTRSTGFPRLRSGQAGQARLTPFSLTTRTTLSVSRSNVSSWLITGTGSRLYAFSNARLRSVSNVSRSTNDASSDSASERAASVKPARAKKA